jgi:outer membrane protein TolC
MNASAGSRVAILMLAAALAGCASYQARPLPTTSVNIPSITALKIDPARLRLEPLKSVVVDPSDGLDPLEIAVLAVLNDPDLDAKRAAAGVSAAQIFTAGLLPDPQISATYDHPVSGPDHHEAFGAAPTIDLAGLMARSYVRRGARALGRQADLNLLWAEWGVAQQARQLAETALADEDRGRLLQVVFAAAKQRADDSNRALQRRDVTLQTAAADLAVELDAQTQLTTARHDAAKARRDLAALLNLSPDVVLPLVPGPALATYDEAAITRDLATLPQRRPDLLALRAGYNAEDATLRKAILAQFPIAQIGAAIARDPANTVTVGVSSVLALPIFNGGRGEVRLQTATREQLRAEYQARLDQTAAEARSASAEVTAASATAAALRAEVPRLEGMVRPALAAYRRGDIDSQTYLTLSQSALARRVDLNDRETAARVAEIQLETALFLPPAVSRISP